MRRLGYRSTGAGAVRFGFSLAGFCIFCALAVPVWAQTVDEEIDEAVQLYGTRQINADNLPQSYELLSRIARENPGNVRAHYELSHVCYIMGDVQQSKTYKLKYYDEGYAIGRKAIEIDNNSADAHLWFVVNRGRQGQTRGVLNSLFMIPELKREIAAVLNIDPQNTVAMDVKGMLYYELPSFAGGDVNVAQAALDEAIAIDSNYTVLYVDMAKVQIARKDFRRARWYLNRSLEVENPTYPDDFELDDKPDAERMLAEIDGK
jgi:tetratricopeptide (TPR) repeat protein